VIGQGYRRGFTAAEKTELWDRWQRGESLKAIGRAFGKPSSSIYFQLAPHGGIRPLPRRRSRLALKLSEREEISRGIAAAQSARSMARLLGRSPSTVTRELSRNGGYDRYRAALADETAWARARRPKRCKLANNPRLRQAVASKLRLNWSPEQTAGWLKRARPGDGCYHADRSGQIRMAIDEGKSRISCQSVSGRRRLLNTDSKHGDWSKSLRQQRRACGGGCSVAPTRLQSSR